MSEWKKVFKAAIDLAKKIREKNPKMLFSDAVKKAWKDPAILKMKSEYDKKKATKKKGSATKPRGRPSTSTKSIRKSTGTKKVVKKTAVKKPTATRSVGRPRKKE